MDIYKLFAALFIISCGPNNYYQQRTKTSKPCSVVKQGHDAIIYCPDGSSAVVKATKVKGPTHYTNTIIVKECKKGKKK